MATKLTKGGFQTIKPPLDILTQSDPDAEKKSNCEAKGGKWDSERQTCVMPEQIIRDRAKDKPSEEAILRDVAGNVTGITSPKGDTFLGIREDQLPSGALQDEQVRLAAEQREQQAVIEKEKAKLSAEEMPQRRELSPSLPPLEKIPVLGGVIGVMADYFRPLKKALGYKVNESFQPEVLRTLALTEIERQEIERGLTASEGFGRLIEGTGLSKISFFGLSAKDLIETPSENAKEVKANILKEKRRISNIETNVKMGYLPVSVAREQIIDIEQNIYRLESRIRLLIYKSPELRFNSDFVNTVETEILATKEKAFQSKQNILTGVIEDPTEMEIFLKLQSLIGDEDEE